MNEVERIHGELLSLREIVASANSPSDLSAFDSLASKALLLAAASYFERVICDAIEGTARDTGTSEPFVHFISKQGLKRRYHQLFDWDKTNANSFFSLFGPEFKTSMEAEIKTNDSLKTAVTDFMYLGSQRNQLVHQNFASFLLDPSLEDLWTKFRSALKFAEWLPSKLFESSKKKNVEGLADGEVRSGPV